MRLLIPTLAILWLFCFSHTTLCGQDEATVRNIFATYQEAFNKREIEKLKTLWSKDALYENLTTQDFIQGQDEVVQYFKGQFESMQNETLNVTIDTISFPANGKALVKGTTVTTSKEEQQKSAFIAELIEENKTWLFQKVAEVEILPPPTNYAQLKDLEWLIGKWKGEQDYTTFTINTTWDENKNFIIQKFSVVMLGQKELEGAQIIGWDDGKKKVRSWIFDSDGGFGEGVWNRSDDSWYASMTFTLPDGRKGSETQIYMKKDQNAYTFDSDDRDIEGRLMPDTQAITITRIQ